MLIPFCLVFRVLSSTLLPALHRPCVLGTTRESATLCPFSLWVLLVESVYCRLWQHQRQDRRASLGKTHHLPVYRPASCRFGSPDIRSRSIMPARPPHQHHIAGSLFATYTVLPHASSRHAISGHALALLASSFRPVTADHNVPDARLERRPVRHARHT